MQKHSDGKFKILWAVDPFSRDGASKRKILKTAAASIRALSKDQPTQIYPVYVWTTLPWEVAFESDLRFSQRMQSKGQMVLDRALAQFKLTGVHPLKILPRYSDAQREAAHEVIEYAKRIEAQVIVVSSHGRTGVSRWLLGSFAEVLTLYAQIPLLIVHPSWKAAPSFKRILFPTDFSERSHEVFEGVLEFAQVRKSQITLFHKSGSIGYPAFDFEPAFHAAFSKAVTQEVAAHRKTARLWAERARDRGIKVRTFFDEGSLDSVAQAILRYSEATDSMIAMASRSGPVSAVLLGSTTRQVVRRSENPVWVIHPKEHEQTHLKLHPGWEHAA